MRSGKPPLERVWRKRENERQQSKERGRMCQKRVGSKEIGPSDGRIGQEEVKRDSLDKARSPGKRGEAWVQDVVDRRIKPPSQAVRQTSACLRQSRAPLT